MAALLDLPAIAGGPSGCAIHPRGKDMLLDAGRGARGNGKQKAKDVYKGEAAANPVLVHTVRARSGRWTVHDRQA